MAASEKFATRPFFGASRKEGCAFIERAITFPWHSGLSWQQRQRSSDSLAQAILAEYGRKGLQEQEILEISTASHSYELGQRLSALSLQYCDPATGETHPVENWFQAGKVFARDGQTFGSYLQLLQVEHPGRYVNQHLDAKTAAKYAEDGLFARIQGEIAGARLERFQLGNASFPLVPRSAFYDYLYVRALAQPQNAPLAAGLLPYRVFTDIMFNPGTGARRKFNTQARSCAIFVALSNRGMLEEALTSFDAFVENVAYPVEESGEEAGAQKAPTLF